MFTMKTKTQGFTLIELLVVIAIIGILSSVVLASLNTARNKGADASVKSGLAQVRVQAELYYDSNTNSYAGFCASANTTMFGGISPQAASAVTCADGVSVWRASAGLKGAGGYWCVDWTGTSTMKTAAPSGTSC